MSCEDLDFPAYSNPFQLNVTFYIETSHLICIANQMTGFYMECNAWMKRLMPRLMPCLG